MKLTYRFRPRLSRDWIDTVLQPSPTNDEYLPLLRESAVTLGINRFPSFRHSFAHPATYSRLRDLEGPMLGACYLTENAPGLTDLFEDGVEIETYRTVDELVEKAQALRADPKRRQQLRERGQRRALTQHTIARSIETITRALH
jgi:hypothetical protein